jgi:hypothetical protein
MALLAITSPYLLALFLPKQILAVLNYYTRVCVCVCVCVRARVRVCVSAFARRNETGYERYAIGRHTKVISYNH